MNEIIWSFAFECDIPNDIDDVLVEGETVTAAYKTLRDTALFTNKRIIVRDSQGITGKKVEIYSLPYSSIVMWSSENAGKIDLSSELQLWTRSGNIKINLGRKCDVRRLEKLLASAVL